MHECVCFYVCGYVVVCECVHMRLVTLFQSQSEAHVRVSMCVDLCEYLCVFAFASP
jgi:hypothetical protein